MGEARRRRLAGLAGVRPNPEPPPVVQRHALAMLDRCIETDESGEIVMSDHSAKPGNYASADLRTLYRWDGTMIRRLDRRTLQPHNRGQS